MKHHRNTRSDGVFGAIPQPAQSLVIDEDGTFSPLIPRKRFLSVVDSWTVFAVSAIIVVAAVVLRIAFPYAGNYRAEIERIASEALNQPVRIERVEAVWQGWTPLLRLSRLQLLEPLRATPIASFESAAISLDLWQSLLDRRISPGKLYLSGVRLALVRERDGRIVVEGVNNPEHSNHDGFAAWLLRQADLRIDKAEVIWLDKLNDGRPQRFSDVYFHFKSRGNRYRIGGFATLPRAASRTIYFAVDAAGSPTLTGWSGRAYVETQQLDPHSLLSLTRPAGINVHGRLDSRLWADWRNGELSAFEGDFRAAPLTVTAAGGDTTTINRAGGRFAGRKNSDNSWIIGVDQLDVSTDNGNWPQSSIYASWSKRDNDKAAAFRLEAGFLRLEDILPVIAQTARIDEPTAKLIDALGPSGDVTGFSCAYEPGREGTGGLSLHSKVQRLSVAAYQSFPGISGLSGTLGITPNQGILTLDSRHLDLSYPSLAGHLPVDALQSRIYWWRDRGRWKIASKSLTLTGSGVDLRLAFGALLTDGQAPRVNIMSQFASPDVKQLMGYLPSHVVPSNTHHWFTRSILGGAIADGKAVLRGRISDFPFDRSNGRFQLALNWKNGLLEFHPAWPQVSDIDASVAIDGRMLTVAADGGRIYRAQSTQTQVTLPDVFSKRRVLLVDTDITAPAADAFRFVMNSPLKKTVGRQIKDLEINGDLRIHTELKLPLKKEERRHTLVKGEIGFRRNRLSAEKLGVVLDDLYGTLVFDKTSRTGKDFKASYFGHPVTVNVSFGDETNPDSSWARLTGVADQAFIRSRFAVDDAEDTLLSAIVGKIGGKTPWSATIRFPKYWDEPGATAYLNLISSLDGAELDLPAPFFKAAAERRRLEIEATLSSAEQRMITVRYGRLANADLRLLKKAGRYSLERADIHFGNGDNKTTKSGALIHVTGQIPKLDLKAWMELSKAAEPSPRRKPITVNADLRIDQLDAIGHRFRELNVVANGKGNDLSIVLDGPTVRGHLLIPPNLETAPLVGSFDHFRLNEPLADSFDLDPKTIPALRMQSDAFEFRGVKLDKVILASRPAADGLQVEQLNFSSADFEIKTRGKWTLRDGQHRSSLDVDVTTGNIAATAERFGYAVSALEAKETNVTIKGAWPGKPTDFTFARVSGTLGLDIKQGRLVDINHRVGRIFGLLSFQSLRRRLSLDFDDVFKKGFAFDSIVGSFTVENGNAYTNDFQLTGPSATIELSGRTGLVAQDYDQVVTVTPEFASSLPVASALFGPIGAGVGAAILLAEQVFESIPKNIDKMLRRQYAITGNWDAPRIQPLKREGNRTRGPERNTNERWSVTAPQEK